MNRLTVMSLTPPLAIMILVEQTYGNNSMYWDRIPLANRVDTDQTAPKEQSDLGLHCLQFTQ